MVNFSSEYKLVDALDELGQPSLIETEFLKVSGPVKFSEGVIIKGEVTISNPSNEVKTVVPGVYSDQMLFL